MLTRQRGVGDPDVVYQAMLKRWQIQRAVLNGQDSTKAFDDVLDLVNMGNILIPFSSTMDIAQYSFYKAEAELPGISGQFAKMLIGGLLRRTPVLTIEGDIPDTAREWLMKDFSKDGASLSAFMDEALWEEMQTSRCWISVNHPEITQSTLDRLTREEREKISPYPVIWKAEDIINVEVTIDIFGREVLSRIFVRGFQRVYEVNEFHAEYRETIWLHELDDEGFYRIRKFEKKELASNVRVENGRVSPQLSVFHNGEFTEVDLIENIKSKGERLRFIPFWPLNGTIDINTPMLSTIVDKEISLYNKISRRNHLLYGAATYTPVVIADITEERFEEIVNSGLGSWLNLPVGSSVEALETPTAALADMERAIAAGFEEVAKLGIRMLAPETAQSGVALQLRNAAQTAQMGTLNMKVSDTMQKVVTFMLEWKYGVTLGLNDVMFTLSEDFDPIPLGADWLRLATEWYQLGHIPRYVWIQLLRVNDMLPADYDDEHGVKAISEDQVLNRLNEKELNKYSENLDDSQEETRT